MENEQNGVEAVIHAEKVGPEEQAGFNRRMTVEEIIEVLNNGAPGKKLLLSKTGDPNDNVVVEYRPKPLA